MRILSIVLFIFSTLQLNSQSVTKFYSQVDAKKIVEGSFVNVEFILENGTLNQFNPPKFSGFDVVSGPSRSTSTSIYNGRRSSEVKISYSIKPKTLGQFTIGEASVIAKGKKYFSDPITIEVIKGSANPVSDGQEVFVIAQVSDSVGYVGQQIILDFKLFTLLDVRSVNLLQAPEFDGFYSQELRTNRSGFQREIIGGKEYYTKIVERIALFPQQTGTYRIDPVALELGIATNNSRRSFFFSSSLVPKKVVTAPITIIIKDTPSTNTNFSGAIGKYSMKAATAKRSLTTDEAIIVNMEVTGNGDNKMVLPPTWRSNDSLEVYDPNVLEDKVTPGTNQIMHRKVFEYLLVPKYPGKYKLDAEFTYFDVDSSEYVTISRRFPTINVLKGSNKPVVVEENKALELAGIFTTTKLKDINKKSAFGSLMHWMILGLLLLGLVSLIGYWWYLKNSGKTDPAEIRRTQAFKVAQEKLKLAESLKSPDSSKEFHENISVALKGYLEDKFNIPALHLSKSELNAALKSKHIDPSKIELFESIFQQCEMSIYAPIGSVSLDDVYRKSQNVISDLEK